MKSLMTGVSAVAILLGSFTTAHGVLQINEVLVNAPNGTGGNDGQEFFELLSTSGGVESVDGLRLLAIEGNIDASGNEGKVDDVVSLNGLSTGSNGLLLVREGGSPSNPEVTYDPQPHAQTAVDIQGFTSLNFENDSVTFLLVDGWSGSNGDDLDTNNDGTLDVTPWTEVLDAVAIPNLSTPYQEYATQFGGQAFSSPSFAPDLIFRDPGNSEWLSADLFYDEGDLEPRGGFFFLDADEISDTSGADIDIADFSSTDPGWSPGVANPSRGAGPVRPGDFNNDGVVDAVDYAVWRENLGGDESTLNNNGDGLNGVDAGDYALWRDRYGTVAASATASTNAPEPGSALLMMGVVAAASSYRQRR